MTFLELKELLFWACDNGVDIEDLDYLRSGYDGKLINRALRDLVDCLHIIKHRTDLVLDASGTVTLPTDFYSMQRVAYDGIVLSFVDNINDIYSSVVGNDEDDTGSSVSRYVFLAKNKIQLYSAPKEPYGEIHLWYKAYPPELVNDNDEPSDVPEEYHETLAEIYAKAHFAKKLGDYNQYVQLLTLWHAVKKEIRGVVESRVAPATESRRWVW